MGEWQGQDGAIAAFQGSTWRFSQPSIGWVCWASDEGKLLVFHDDEWREVSGNAAAASQALDHLGINATADEINRLSINASNTLFNHEGTSHRMSINKNSDDDTCSIVFQSGFEAVGEIGLLGDDDLRLKVTRDQTVWHDAMIIDGATGQVSFPNTNFSGSASLPASANLLINSDMKINQRGFEGGLLQAGQYGYDRWRAGSSGAELSQSNSTINLVSGSVLQMIEPELFGYDSFAGKTMTVSFENLSGGNLEIRLGSAPSQIISPQEGQNAVSIPIDFADTNELAMEISALTDSVQFHSCKLETGDSAKPTQLRTRIQELQLCQRYFHSSFSDDIAPVDNLIADNFAGFSFSSAHINVQRIMFPVQMRIIPSISFFGSVHGPAGSGVWQWFKPGFGWLNANTMNVDAQHLVSQSGVQLQLVVADANPGAAYIVTGGYSADAEF